MEHTEILIAGIGNIFFGDDAFGVEVAQRLARRRLPAGVRAVDFGIRSYDLAYALMEKRRLNILVDATPRNGPPGSLYTIEPDLENVDDSIDAAVVEAHTMNPMKVFHMVRMMGGQPSRTILIGCEPESLGDETDGRVGLSEPVSAAVDEAIRLIEGLLVHGEAPN